MTERQHNPEEEEHTHIVQGVAAHIAKTTDGMAQPLPRHIEYAANLIRKLEGVWELKIIEESLPDVMGFYDAACVFEDKQIDIFVQLAMNELRRTYEDYEEELDDFIEDLESEFDDEKGPDLLKKLLTKMGDLEKQQKEAIRNRCVDSKRFKFRDEELKNLLDKLFEGKKPIGISVRHRDFLSKLSEYRPRADD